MLDTYLRMLAEYRRIMDSRKRGFGRLDYLLSLEELERIADARVHPSHRDDGGAEELRPVCPSRPKPPRP